MSGVQTSLDSGTAKAQLDTNVDDIEQNKPQMYTISRKWILMATIVMLVTATYDTLASKFQNRTYLPISPGGPYKYFEAPMLQTFIGNLGAPFILLIYKIECWLSKKHNRPNMMQFADSYDSQKPKTPILLWIIPALVDLSCNLCLNVASMRVQASIVQVLRAWGIIPTFILTAYGLKNRIYWHQIFGVGFVVIGTGVTGYNAFINPDPNTNYSSGHWVGILAAIIGTCAGSLLFLMEEAIFRYYSCSPFESSGYMGIYNIFTSAGVLAVFHYTGKENIIGSLYQMTLGNKEANLLLFSLILFAISVGLHMLSGVMITKLASCLLRVVINSGRIITVYVFALILGWESFMPLHLAGVILILIAIFTYNYSYIDNKFTNGFCLDTFFRKTIDFLPAKYEVTYNKAKISDLKLNMK